MFPTSKHRDAVHSGAGVFYQAMPAVGDDGKNIMTLIPVKLVNGQFIRYEIRKRSVDSTIQKAVNISSAPLPIVTNVSNVLPRGGLDPGNSRNNHRQHQQTESLMSKVPTRPATNCVNSVRLPYQLPVMVKSPALPKGQLLQIPPNAHVRTLPASKLPPGIKKQIFNSSGDSTPVSGVPSVVFVSPVTTVSQCAAPPWHSGPQSPRLPSQTEKTAKISKPLLKLIPKASPGPDGPTRWVIEEEDTSTASYMHSHSVASQIIRTVVQREKTDQYYNVSESNLDTSGQDQDNALIMCNGKVFFVAKKSSLLFQQGENDSPTAATKSSETTEPLFQHPVELAVPQTQQEISIIISDEPDEVIDLCDDNTQDDSQQAPSVSTSAVSHQDDDNVIFVSYIPPKSEAELTHDSTVETQTTIEKDIDLLNTSRSDSLTQEKSLGGRADADGRDEGATLTGGRSGTVENVTHVCASAGTSVNDDEGSNMNSKQSTSTQQEGSMGGDVDPETPADGSSEACSHKQEEAPPGCQTTSPAPPPCKMSDRQLRQMFGITVDVKIYLQRIDEASAGLAEARSSQFIKDRHEPANGLKEKELFLQDFYRSCENQNDDVKREKVLTEWEKPADAATVTAHTDVMSLECAVFKLNTKPLSELGQSSPKGASCGVENTTLIGYVEPIDEDFLNANEIAEFEDVATHRQSQTCVDMNTNTSRIRRTRKRTMCPCCIPGTPEPAVKFKSEELEKWACRTEQISKKGTRTKAARKGVITSGNSCLTVRNNQKSKTHEVRARDSLSSTSTDPDELQRDRQIQRLKELLKEREAALELMEHGAA